MEQQDLLSNDLLINDISQANLTSAAKWGKFLSIVGFVGCVLMMIGGIYVASGASSISAYAYGREAAMYVGVTYVITAIILFFPCLYLNKFSNKTQDAIWSTNQESIEAAFINLKSMFKFYGIVTIISLVFFALAFIVGISNALMQ